MLSSNNFSINAPNRDLFKSMNPSGVLLSAQNSGRLNSGFVGNPENMFDFRAFYEKKKQCSDDNLAQKVFFEDLQPKAKYRLSDLVTDEDDLGPELVMNVKWLDAYRYPSETVYLYLDLI